MPMSEAQQQGIKASNAAKARLIELHQEEFDALQSEERVKLGLPAEKAKKGASLNERIAKAQEKLNELLAQQAA